jgi:hypothetical protein
MSARTLHLKDLSLLPIQIYNKGKIVNLSIENDPLKFSIGPMFLPFDIKFYPNKWTNIDDVSLDCSLNKQAVDYNSLNEKMCELDNHLSNLITENSNFKDSVYTSFYKNNNPSYPKLCKLNFMRDKFGNFKTMIYDENRQKIEYNEKTLPEIMKRHTVFNVLITSNKIWNTQNKKCGIQFDIEQILILKQKSSNLSFKIEETSTDNQSYILLD